MLLEKLDTILRTDCNLEKKGKLVVAVSGGPDSVCLLDILFKLGFDCIVGHFNHQLRGDSEAEMRFVHMLCDQYHLECITGNENIKKIASDQKKGIEEIAREKRYQFLFAAAEAVQADAVIVGHHADDQVETMIMNLLRGSGLDGLTGMKFVSFGQFSQKIPLIRPMLTTFRDEILVYNKTNDLHYVMDNSNLDTGYLRNRIRHELIPMLSTYNPKIKKNLMRMMDLLKEDQKAIEFLLDSSEKEINTVKNSKSVHFKLDTLSSQICSIQRSLIKRFLSEYFNLHDLITMDLIEKVRCFFLGRFNTNVMVIGEDIVLVRQREEGIIARDIKSAWGEKWPLINSTITMPLRAGVYELENNWQLQICEINRSELDVDYSKNIDPFSAYCDREKIDNTLNIRKWQSGDRFKPIGMNGKSTKLSDFWINHKIPKHARNSWPLVVSSDNIIWIPGFQPSHMVRIHESTEKVIVLRIYRA